ncbi:MazG nucleotide pyrophosphohydrolase domain-containing protein [Mogibacterium neglectum]|uniref:MazG nucleotide pyrophosphohydrolase domain-containing protein n=1 Tax=Mogibacterium neglectum TaxID=114528 RepID=UPI00272AF2F4|nr:MazG nucleotide pyrophosphohydrolase domain-containing protein [Mogibacterium neglectum]WLD76148.1 MazG nucleotide pyrophosphohydrolase domain-containing protein [Mogibacterium neglectum]
MKMTTKEFLENANAEMGRKVWEHYGEEAQTKKLVEELAELITAIAREDTRAIREEMADVEVMIMQFKQGLNIDTLPIMNYKLHRQLARIENENNNK